MTESEAVAGTPGTVALGRQSTFAGDVLRLAGGTTFAQMVSVLVAPILTRVYSPDAFGTAAVFASIAGIIGVVACLRYERAVMLPERDEDAANLLAVGLLSVLAITALTTVTVLVFRGPLVRLVNAPQLAAYLWVLPVAVLASGVSLGLNYWNSRTRHFGRMSVARGAQSVVTNGVQLGIAATGHASAAGLIGARVLGAGLVTSLWAGRVWSDDRGLLRRSLNWRGALGGLRRHYKFPLYGIWTGLLNTISWELPVLMLARFFAPTTVGFYALANRAVRLPMTVIGGAIAQVFFQRSAEAKIQGGVSRLVERVYGYLVAFGLFPMLLLTVTGRELFVTLFGDRWGEAGVYAQILGVYMFFNFIASPLAQLFSVLERQEAPLFINVVLFAARLGSLWIGGQTGDPRLTLGMFAACGVLVYGGYSMWILRAAGVALSKWWLCIVRTAVVCGFFVGSSSLVCVTLGLDRWGRLATHGAAAVLYFAWLIRTDYEVAQAVKRMCAIVPWNRGR